MKQIIKLMSTGLRIKYLALSALAIVGAYLISIAPVYLGQVLDNLSTGKSDLTTYVLRYLLVFFFAEALNIFRRVAIDRVGVRFGEELRNTSVDKLLHLPLRNLNSCGTSAETASKISNAVDSAAQLLRMLPNGLLPAVFIGIFVVIQCLTRAPQIIAVTMLAYIVFSLILSLAQIKSQRGIRVEIARRKAALDGEIGQSILGIVQIRACGAESDEPLRLAPQSRTIRQIESKHHTIMGSYDLAKHLAKVLFFAAILLLGVTMSIEGTITNGVVVSIVLLAQQLIKPLDEFYRFLDEIGECAGKVELLSATTNQGTDKIFLIESGKEGIAENHIEVNCFEVFSPETGKVISKVLAKNGFRIAIGKNTALKAESGCGKSSLINGLLRIYPSNGDVNIFGRKLSDVSQMELTRIIHYIPQDPWFFAGTLRDNLTYGLKRTADDSELISALKQACIFDEFFRLAEGTPLDYLLQEKGGNVSGGQRKRL